MVKKRLQKGEIAMGPTFFLSGRIFPPNWPEKSVKSWHTVIHSQMRGKIMVVDLCLLNSEVPPPALRK